MELMTRRGSLLIIVSGLCTLLAILAVAFLGRARTDIDEADFAQRQGQARIMLSAACCYLLEAAPPATHDPVVAAGTNAFFPRLGTLSTSSRLIGRFPMQVQTLPRHAVTPRHTFDPYDGFRPYDWRNDPTRYQTVANPLTPGGLLTANEIMPATQATAAGGTAASFPIARTMNMSWFRVWYPGATPSMTYSEGAVPYCIDPASLSSTRAAKATFIVTCGAGASLGFRDWSEVTVADQPKFGNDSANFAVIVANETRLWYQVEWSTINVYADAKPSTNAHPPLYSDPSDTALYSTSLFILPSTAPNAAPLALTTGNQYVFPWDPIRKDLTTTNDLSAPNGPSSPAVPPLAAQTGWNKFPQSLESDAFRYHGRIVRITRLASAPAGGNW